MGNFAPLTSCDWQVHVYGEASPALRATCSAIGIPLHSYPWQDAMRHAGFLPGAAYLVRPDGYVAVAATDAHAAVLEDYVAVHGLSVRGRRVGSTTTPAPAR
jgi:hypothetical protein